MSHTSIGKHLPNYPYETCLNRHSLVKYLMVGIEAVLRFPNIAHVIVGFQSMENQNIDYQKIKTMSKTLKKEDFVVYVNPLDNKHYQEVYASQVYGTFFAVYAKFIGAELTQDKCQIAKVELKVVNYKGLYDLGLVNVNSMECDDEINVKKVQLEMRAMNPLNKKNEPQYNMTFEMDQSFSKGEVLCFERSLFMLHDKEVASEKGLFDSEFFYREGLREDNDYERRKPVPRQPNLNSGLMCPESNVIILWP